jgi:3-oxoacyl-[acyl-carrier protein] reductase
MDLEIAGRTALVLGASRGLGAAIARALSAEGARVLAAARTAERIAAWKAELPASQAALVEPLKVDLSRIQDVDALADSLLPAGVDILINNTGGPPLSSAQAALREQWTGSFEAMAANLFHLTQRLLPPMRERRWGRIITITSSGIEQPIPQLAISTGIRLAVAGWSKALATEIAADGVTVNVVLPGRIATERVHFLDQSAAERNGVPIEEAAKMAAETIPMKRYGTPEEFADAVAFLASARASYITGSKIRVDGGTIRTV